MSRASLPRLAAVAGLASLLVVGAACGDSDDDDASTTTAASSSTTEGSSLEPSDDTGAEAGDDTTTTEADDAATTTEEAQGADEPADACTLVTAEDATEALGEEAVPGSTQESDLCIWGDSLELRTVQLAILSDDPDEWRAARQAGEFEPVEGVGEEAYYGPVFDDLSFLVDGQVYEIDVELRGEGDAREVATALAETVISRL